MIRRGSITAALLFTALAFPSAALANFGSLSLISANSSGTVGGNDSSFSPSATPDGRFVAFGSSASDLVPGDANGATDVFVRDVAAGTTSLVSRSVADPSASANGSSLSPLISDDGRYVAFRSKATNLAAGQNDTNGAYDVFLHDNTTGSTVLVSHVPGGGAPTGTGGSVLGGMSADGRYVTFTSENRLVDGQTGGNATDDNYYIWNRDTGNVSLVNHVAGSQTTAAPPTSIDTPFLSADGSYVTYLAESDAIVPGAGSGGNAFLYRVSDGHNSLVSHAATGPTDPSDGSSSPAAISGDGRYVVYVSSSTDLMTGQVDSNPPAPEDAFLYDRVTDTSTLISHAPDSAVTATNNVGNFWGTITRDGSRVAWLSGATDLVAGESDSNGRDDAFLYDRASNSNRLVSHTAGSATTTGDRATSGPVYLSPGGRYVAFPSEASDLVPGEVDANGNLNRDVYAFDSTTGVTTLVSHSLSSATTTANDLSDPDGFAGERVILESRATDLFSGVTSGNEDLFMASNRAPADSFDVDHDSGPAPLAVAFKWTGTDPDNTVTSYRWDFGDGTSGSGASVSHVYTAAGTYTVTLTAMGDAGTLATAHRTVTVTAASQVSLPSLSALVTALSKRVAGPCHRKLESGFAVLACGGNKRGNPNLRVYVVNARSTALTLKVGAQEALPRNAAALKRVRYKLRTIKVAPGGSRGVTLKAPRKLRVALSKALRKHRSVTRRPLIAFSAAGVKRTTFTHRVVLRAPKRSR